jgi:hypothetical protein
MTGRQEPLLLPNRGRRPRLLEPSGANFLVMALPRLVRGFVRAMTNRVLATIPVSLKRLQRSGWLKITQGAVTVTATLILSPPGISLTAKESVPVKRRSGV